MTQATAPRIKIPTNPHNRPRAGRPSRRAGEGTPAGARPVLANGIGRAATRSGGEAIELEHGITVYPAREDHGRWPATSTTPGPTPGSGS